jgi:hypothetical protein
VVGELVAREEARPDGLVPELVGQVVLVVEVLGDGEGVVVVVTERLRVQVAADHPLGQRVLVAEAELHVDVERVERLAPLVVEDVAEVVVEGDVRIRLRVVADRRALADDPHATRHVDGDWRGNRTRHANRLRIHFRANRTTYSGSSLNRFGLDWDRPVIPLC